MKSLSVAPTSTGSSLTPAPRRGASRATRSADANRPTLTIECNPRHQAPAGARSGDAPTRSHGDSSMRKLVLLIAGKGAAVPAAIQALADRVEGRA